MITLNCSFLIHIIFIYLGYCILYNFFSLMYEDVIADEKEEADDMEYLKTEVTAFEKEESEIKLNYETEKNILKKIVSQSLSDKKVTLKKSILSGTKKPTQIMIDYEKLSKKTNSLKAKLETLLNKISH
jgi:hypothetical protein